MWLSVLKVQIEVNKNVNTEQFLCERNPYLFDYFAYFFYNNSSIFYNSFRKKLGTITTKKRTTTALKKFSGKIVRKQLRVGRAFSKIQRDRSYK